MATSTVPALKANLQTQLQARGGLAGVNVTYGPPLPSPGDEYIWIGDTDGAQVFATYGSTTGLRHEEYQLQVVICVERQGTDMKGADTRCFALLAELEAQLRADNTVNGAVTLAQVGGFKLSEIVTDMSRTAQLEVQVSCEAYI